MPSLPPVSAKVIADAEQFIAEFRRAENASRRSMSSMDREIDRFSKSVKKKFQFGDLGKDILRGAGLFGGFQIANTAAELLVGHFRAAAEEAKSIEESSARSLAHVQKMISLRQTDEQRLATMEKERARLAAELGRLQTPSTRTRRTTDVIDGMIVETGSYNEQMPLTGSAKEQIRETLGQLERVDEELDTLRKKVGQTQEAVVSKEFTHRTKVLNEQLREQEKAFDDIVAAQKKKNEATAKDREEMDALAQKYREIADPALVFKNQLAEIDTLMGSLSVEEYTRAIDAVNRAMAADKTSRIDKALSDFFGEMDDRSRMVSMEAKDASAAARELGMTFTSAFEDAVIEGEKFSEVLRAMEKDLLRLALRKSVTEPLFNAAMGAMGTGGMMAGIGKLFGFAHGGDFTVGGGGGTDSQVVAFRATPGESVSVRTPGQQASGGGGTYYIDARGADREGLAILAQKLQELNASIEPRAIGAVLQRKFRSAGYRRALAG